MDTLVGILKHYYCVCVRMCLPECHSMYVEVKGQFARELFSPSTKLVQGAEVRLSGLEASDYVC